MSNTSIKVENLSKIYRLGEIGTGTISRDMERWFKTKVLKQEDPFLKIGETNERANKGKSDIVYSLQDIDFEIQQGDAVGIIGRNGAGKSTLLKILSRVTTPTTGRINIKGRVASLLEVGTGFHPELTGRENIYLNGAILGMRKREIDRKLDEIIDFSGVERHIDTPVKRYSSGMYIRLAFGVAANLESEILIVDEVLAVGDLEFQKKCLSKMNVVSKNEGRTVLFVSHNLSAVEQLCNAGIVLQNGLIFFQGSVQHSVKNYLRTLELESDHLKIGRVLNNRIEVQYEINTNGFIYTGETLFLELSLNALVSDLYCNISFHIANNEDVNVLYYYDQNRSVIIPRNKNVKLNVNFPELYLNPGIYFINIWIGRQGVETYIEVKRKIAFEILQNENVLLTEPWLKDYGLVYAKNDVIIH